jgi:prepilin-type N-terminal cleavage/methylation domain-containing protein
VKPVLKKLKRSCGFTIIELITVMSVILILMSLLLPALNQMRRYAYEVKEKHQLRGIDVALEFFNADWERYPDSGQPAGLNPNESEPFDADGNLYCGAMRLAEALIGQDQFGFNIDSRFYQSGYSSSGYDWYPGRAGSYPPLPPPAWGGRSPKATFDASLEKRKDLYLKLESANAAWMGDLFQSLTPPNIASVFGADAATLPVICDVFPTVGDKGMPVLYYKANILKRSHNVIDPKGYDDPDNIYNYKDNDCLLALGLQTQATPIWHPMASNNPDPKNGPWIFYDKTWNKKLSVIRPYRADSFILISAGFDGLYGTKDDIFNFEK